MPLRVTVCFQFSTAVKTDNRTKSFRFCLVCPPCVNSASCVKLHTSSDISAGLSYSTESSLSTALTPFPWGVLFSYGFDGGVES